MDQIQIGKFIAELRKEKNMTQRDLATRLGITDRAVSKWENGRGMPDISLINTLCEELGISINELLRGERIAAEQTLEIANENMLGMLSYRERIIKVRDRCLAVCIIILVVIAVVISFSYAETFSSRLYAELRGDGYSFTAIKYEKRAKPIVKYISDGDYEKAAQYIGFYTDDRDAAEKQWIASMDEAFGSDLRIKHFVVDRAVEDDEFITGYATLIVEDRESDQKYVFDVVFTPQYGGIAFGLSTYYSGEEHEGREGEIGKIIDEALSTWYAG